jgi:hypothetical protein
MIRQIGRLFAGIGGLRVGVEVRPPAPLPFCTQYDLCSNRFGGGSDRGVHTLQGLPGISVLGAVPLLPAWSGLAACSFSCSFVSLRDGGNMGKENSISPFRLGGIKIAAN